MNTLTLSLSTATRTALQAEADTQNLSLERHINEILTRRVNRPHWSDVAENQLLAAELERVTGERDRARDTAVLLENDGALLNARIGMGIASGEVVASRRFLARYGLAPESEGAAK